MSAARTNPPRRTRGPPAKAVAFVCRLLPLTCLAPDLVEAILDGRQLNGLRLAGLLGNGPVVWEEQRRLFGKGCDTR
jgi:hypothetical protein